MEHVRASRAEIAADLAVQGFDLLRSVSAIYSLDTNEPRRLTGCRRSLRRTGSDSEAVELRPDLVVLDIGLPSLNGIEVARQIRSLVPESIIIFLTQESSADVVQKAFSVGVRGYVAKRNAVSDLLAAVDTVLLGGTFFSKL
jgi:DNA-binding NarL/FixJ family response regulator